MQKLKKDKYHAPINPGLLYRENIKFHSKYSIWVYIFLKLWQLYYLQRDIKNIIKVDYDELEQLFRTSRTTLSYAVHELVNAGLLIKKGFNKFSLVDENKVLNNDGENFIQIYNNHFLDLLNRGLSIRQLQIYYHLVYSTYYISEENGFTQSRETQTSVTKKIKSRGLQVKQEIEGLKEMGLVGIGKKGRLFVKTQKGDVKKPKPEKEYKPVPKVINSAPDFKNTFKGKDLIYASDTEGRKYQIDRWGKESQLMTKEDYERELRDYEERIWKPFNDNEEIKNHVHLIRITKEKIEAIVRLEELDNRFGCNDDEVDEIVSLDEVYKEYCENNDEQDREYCYHDDED